MDPENNDDYAGFVIRLIEAVRERAHIYDKKHVSYFNRIEREKAWHEIAELLGQSVDECQKRWKLLREKLFKELIKRDRIVASGDDFHSDWACFERMNFIEHHISVRKKHERFAPYQLIGTTPDTNEAIQSSDDAVANIMPPVGKRAQRQHAISYKRLFPNGHFSVLAADADTSNTSIKEEPTDMLELEQHFEDSTQKDDTLKTNPKQTNVIQEPVQMSESLKVKSFEKDITESTNDTDVVFGKLVTAMLKDIPSEAFRDDAKLQVMQLLIHAKRNAVKILGSVT